MVMCLDLKNRKSGNSFKPRLFVYKRTLKKFSEIYYHYMTLPFINLSSMICNINNLHLLNFHL